MRDGLYIGLMSGTSMDGIDAALIELKDANLKLREFMAVPYAPGLRGALESLVQQEHATLSEFGRLHVEIGQAFANAALALIRKCCLDAQDVAAIGSHGQTVLHKPDATPPFSLQLGDASVIAFRTRVITIADFRSKDIAAGGQGAPLVPAFHEFAFGNQRGETHAVLNLGGIANLTIFAKQLVLGFDCGPGNTLMDRWVLRCRGLDFDRDGEWARTGVVNEALLRALLEDTYFLRQGPKSSGRDHFNLTWLLSRLTSVGTVAEADVQATLAELTASSIADALNRSVDACSQLAVCGGGVRNVFLMERLSAHLPRTRIVSTSELGIPAEAVEACAFAWLAARRLSNEHGNIPAVTGAPEPLVLGAIHHPG